MASQEIVGIIIGHANIIRETPKAICLNVWDESNNGKWFPKSQIALNLPESKIEHGTIEMPWWLARDRFTTDGIYAMARQGYAYLKS